VVGNHLGVGIHTTTLADFRRAGFGHASVIGKMLERE